MLMLIFSYGLCSIFIAGCVIFICRCFGYVVGIIRIRSVFCLGCAAGFGVIVSFVGISS